MPLVRLLFLLSSSASVLVLVAGGGERNAVRALQQFSQLLPAPVSLLLHGIEMNSKLYLNAITFGSTRNDGTLFIYQAIDADKNGKTVFEVYCFTRRVHKLLKV